MDKRVVAAAVVVVVALAAFGGYRVSLRRQVVALENEIRASGAPVTLAELNAWYETPPDGDNAARAYVQAFDALADVGDNAGHLPVLGDAELPPRTAPIPYEMRQAISRHLDANAAALELVEHAVGRPRCRFPIDLRDGLDTERPHLPQLRQTARLLMLQAVLAAHEQMKNAAYRALSTQLAVVHALDDEPTMVSQLTRFDCAAVAVQTLEQVLNRTALAPEQLSELIEGFQRLDEAHALARGLAGRRCFVLDVARNSGAFAGYLDSQARWAPITARLWSWSGVLTRDRVDGARWITQLYYASQGHFPDGLEVAEAVRAEATAVPGWRSPLAKLLVAPLPAAVETEARHRALMRLAFTALAAEQHSLAHGRPPETLSQLVPDILAWGPEDPYVNAAELLYQRTANGCVVYSRGLDGEDDGGAEKPDLEKAWREGDLTLTVERLAGG